MSNSFLLSPRLSSSKWPRRANLPLLTCALFASVCARPAWAQAPLGGAPDSNAPDTVVNTDDAVEAPASRDSNAKTLLVDDFEDGVAAWKLDNARLVGAVQTSAGNPFVKSSQSAGLFTFKAGRRSQASVTRRVDGQGWARINAQRLSFYLSADGDTRPGAVRGVDITLRAIGPNGAEAFRPPIDAETGKPLPIKLDRAGWRRVSIPLGDFRSARGPLTTSAMRRVYALQLSQTGTWDARFFSLDQIAVESGAPATTATPPVTSLKTPLGAPTPDPNAVAVAVDFKKVEGRIAASANPSIGRTQSQSGEPDRDPFDNPDFRTALTALAPRFVRLDAGALCELINSSAPAFDFSRLQSAAQRARDLGALPFIAVTSPPDWALDVSGYAVFARGCANATKASGARYFELSPDSVTFYNSARSALKAVNGNYRVGGQGDSLDEGASLRALLGGANGLDFLSVADFGANADSFDAITQAASAQKLRAVAQVLRASKFKTAALYVSRANVHSLQSGMSGDGINPKSLSAATWWAAYLSSASRVANQVFHEDASNPDAGLLNSDASAYPAYYAMYLWNTFFPSGSARVRATSSRSDIVACAVNTATAHNLLLVNASSRPQTAQISIRGFPRLRGVRMRVLDSPSAQPRYVLLPKSPYQSIALPPYAVATVQFIEGAKRK